MTECEDTRAAWGAVCRTCGETLPNPAPIRSWMAIRHAGSDDHRRMAIKSHFYRTERAPGQGLYSRGKVA